VDPTTDTVVAGAGRAGYAMSLDEGRSLGDGGEVT
jgi:hypothetical protein